MSSEGGWANPAPAALVALAVACFCFFAFLTGKVGPGFMPLLGCWLVACFVIQLVAALIELKEGILLGGNVFLFFSAFFMLCGGLEFFVKYMGANGLFKVPLAPLIDGYAWLVLLIILVLWTPAYMKTSTAVMGLLLITVDFSVFFVVVTDLGLFDGKLFAGYGLLVSGIIGIYMASAIILNDAFKRPVLPLPGPMIK